MFAIADELAAILSTVRRPGDFFVSGSQLLHAPRIEIAGVGVVSLPLPAELLASLAPHTLVADVVTSPAITPLLALARERGCPIQTGPEMALAQLGNLGHFMGVTPLTI